MYRNAATHPEKVVCVRETINSTVTILNEDFVIAGEIMVFSILHGGPAPFLDPIVYKFLAKLPLQVDDCSPSQHKTVALQVCITKLLGYTHNLRFIQFYI